MNPVILEQHDMQFYSSQLQESSGHHEQKVLWK